jgi:NAD+ synthase (glutamine-hydrolysing)
LVVSRLRVALCQIDTVVGDVEGNANRIIDWLRRAEADGADVAAFPELAITGYPPEDLLLKPAFVADNLAALERVAAAAGSCVALVGFVDVAADRDLGDAVAHAAGAGVVAREAAIRGAPRQLRNGLAVCVGGGVLGVYHKRRLPNYGVFDEERWFAPGTTELELYEVAGVPMGVSICEDLWFPAGPVSAQAAAGAQLVVNINASPYSIGRLADRKAVARLRSSESGCTIAYVNQVGGQDELVFDGGSFIVDPVGNVLAEAPQFTENAFLVDISGPDVAADGAPRGTDRGAGPHPQRMPVLPVSATPRASSPLPPPPPAEELSREAEVYGALVLGTRDYLRKNGFSDAVIGLSGGVDSSLVAAIAVDALGAEHVHGLSLPSMYSSEGSRADAAVLAMHLGIELHTLSIERAHEAFAELLVPLLGGMPAGLTDENLQSRIRGVVLMAVSNMQGWIVLTTGNKSEMATGYSTLYGDTAGGFAVIKDVPKTLVSDLCRYRNTRAGTDLIPESVLNKAPSAELRFDQRDDQSLPPYEVLDPVLDALVLNDRSIADVAGDGFDVDLVAKVASLVDTAEYKRRQSPPGVRISAKAFGKDRRIPITNRYRDHAPASAGASSAHASPRA